MADWHSDSRQLKDYHDAFYAIVAPQDFRIMWDMTVWVLGNIEGRRKDGVRLVKTGDHFMLLSSCADDGKALIARAFKQSIHDSRNPSPWTTETEKRHRTPHMFVSEDASDWYHRSNHMVRVRVDLPPLWDERMLKDGTI